MTDNVAPLLYWVKEREAMRLRKLGKAEGLRPGGIGPVTADPILREYRFCSVRRKDDRASQWLIKNVLTEENINLNLQSFLEFSAFCRWCNWPPTIAAVIAEGFYPRNNIDWAAVGRFIDHLPGKTWTGAYMIRAGDTPGQSKGAFICEEVIATHFRGIVPDVIDLLVTGDATFQNVHSTLQEAKNFGSFMSGQVAGDWSYTSLLRDAPDLKTWAPMGPGSIRGFNRIVGHPVLSQPPREELWLEKIVAWRSLIVKKLGTEYEDITALDTQNTLCETDKYLRVKNGEGRPRAKYTPHTY